jgi:hypothetical protein
MEQLLHYAWHYRLLPLRDLTTTNGKTVEVLDKGLPNRNAGPDFLNAKVKIDGVLWAGNIEMHSRASDWQRHKHHEDTAYDSVILHIVEQADTQVCRTDGTIIPQLVLSLSDAVRRNYATLTHPANLDTPACAPILPQIALLKVHTWITALTYERLEHKVKAIQARLDGMGQGWEQAFFITLARNFGFGVNSEAFEQWARLLPITILQKRRDNQMQIEALFLGSAGLLREEAVDDYTHRLQQEYQHLCTLYSLSTQTTIPCKLLRIRPQNFPHLRIAQLAALYTRKPFLFSELMEADTLDKVLLLLHAEAGEYWHTHLRLGVTTDKQRRALSLFSLRLLVINTVIPFLYAYGKHGGRTELCERAVQFLEALPPENNHILRLWKSIGVGAGNAGDSQALIQLTNEYCHKHRCLDCTFGYEYMKGTS